MDQTTLDLSDDLVRRVRPISKCGAERLAQFITALRIVDRRNIHGDVVECGIWKGANLIIARNVSPARLVWGFDTFTGMPPPGPHDLRRSGGAARQGFTGKSAVSRNEVERILLAHGVRDQVRLVEGMVEDTLADTGNLPARIAVLRLDTDWYTSTKVELEVLYPRLAAGGVLIVDDFGHWQGARRAVEEYFRGRMPPFQSADNTAISLIKP